MKRLPAFFVMLVLLIPACLSAQVSFEALPSLTVPGSDFRHIQATDLDHNGVLDLLASDPSAGQIVACFGNGDGTFQSAVPLASGLAGVEHAIAKDLDDDGLVDLLTSVGTLGQVRWYPGDGSGTFSSYTLIATNRPNVRFAQAMNLNNDPYLDLVYADPWDVVYVSYGNSNGWGADEVFFQDPVNQPFAVGKLDADNDDDLLFTGYVWGSDHDMHAFFNPDLGDVDEFSMGNSPSTIKLFDFNNDGVLDVAGMSIYNLSWKANNGNQTFATTLNLVATGSPAASSFVDFDAADFDGDGDADIALLAAAGNTFVICENQDDGIFSETYEGGQLSQDGPEELLTADVDNDGDPDVLVYTSDTGAITTFLNQGFPVPEVLPWDADLNADGSVDSADVLALLGDFGCVAPDCLADLDGDETVGVADVLWMLGYYGVVYGE